MARQASPRDRDDVLGCRHARSRILPLAVLPMTANTPAPRIEAAPAPDLGVRAAWLYYVEGLTQQEIARVLNVSRARVIRLLAAASFRK